MEKKIAGFWVKVPCLENCGSCTYTDTCKEWATACPKYFEKYGLPCNCPIPAKTYSVSDVLVSIVLPCKDVPVPAGDYRFTANLISTSAGHQGCLQVLATLAT